MIAPPTDLRRFASLVEIVESLRSPEGCPWDKEQTHQSLAPYAIEEAHELAEAIEATHGQPLVGVAREEIIGELGDLLLQVVLHAEIARQAGCFQIEDVIAAISEKMVRRHPHVFADTEVANSAEVLQNWSQIKSQEKAQKGKPAEPDRFDVPLSLPALARAHKIGEKTKQLKFDWTEPMAVFEKVFEELAELKAELQLQKNNRKIENELGDVFFSLAQLARHVGLEAEQCLRRANRRFEKRFFTMKKQITESGQDFAQLNPEQLENAWQQVKVSLKNEE